MNEARSRKGLGEIQIYIVDLYYLAADIGLGDAGLMWSYRDLENAFVKGIGATGIDEWKAKIRLVRRDTESAFLDRVEREAREFWEKEVEVRREIEWLFRNLIEGHSVAHIAETEGSKGLDKRTVEWFIARAWSLVNQSHRRNRGRPRKPVYLN